MAGGRPTKQPDEKRSARFNLRFTAAELAQIEAQAHIAGLGPHEFLRRRSLGYVVPPRSQGQVDPAIVSELNAVGNNVNQLARATHRGTDFVRYWQEIGTKLEDVLELVLDRD